MNSKEKRAADRRLMRAVEKQENKFMPSMAHYDPEKRRANRRLGGAPSPYHAFLGMCGPR